MGEKNSGYKVVAISKQLLSDRVYEALKSAIVNGDLPPETRLVETDIATQMEVSPTPVREAFKKLSAEGFVTIIPWQGVRVRLIDDQDILETYQCREFLEALAVRLAADKVDEPTLRQLERILRESAASSSPTEVAKLNSDFHNVIIAIAGNQRLKVLLATIHEIILRDRHVTAYLSSRRKQIEGEHQDILKALRDRDKDAAEQAMRRHVVNGLENYRERKASSRPALFSTKPVKSAEAVRRGRKPKAKDGSGAETGRL